MLTDTQAPPGLRKTHLACVLNPFPNVFLLLSVKQPEIACDRSPSTASRPSSFYRE
jgi:hypothetical protein